jgi:hypothetical protein
MADVAFKDLCLDTCAPDLVAPFWAGILGLDARRQDGGDWELTGPTPQHMVWVNTVPEPGTVKSRVHLDVRFPEGALPDAPVVAQHEHWTVMQDPDGLVFCAFGPREDAPAGAFELVVDSVDPLAQAQWWAERLGAVVNEEDGVPWVWLTDVPGFPMTFWVFVPVPERKTVKNRVHWDVTGGVEVLVDAGASVLDVQPGWTVLADPEGNEFCCFSP